MARAQLEPRARRAHDSRNRRLRLCGGIESRASTAIVRFIEAAAVLLTLLSVIFQIYENIWGWPTTIAGAALYALLFFHERLYADMGLQGIYITLGIYGWYAWLHGGEAHSERRVSNAPFKLQAIAFAIGALSSLVLGFTFRFATNAALPVL